MASKKDLVKAFAERVEMSQAEAKLTMEEILNVITDTLVEDGEVSLSPFGKFVTVDRAERNGRNPQTGEALVIPATTVAKFRPSKQLKETVKG